MKSKKKEYLIISLIFTAVVLTGAVILSIGAIALVNHII
jgi:hypothetical protein